MASIAIPQKKQDGGMFGNILGAAGSVIGGIYGGPAGAYAGGKIGSSLGGNQQTGQGSQALAGLMGGSDAGSGSGDAMSRRLGDGGGQSAWKDYGTAGPNLPMGESDAPIPNGPYDSVSTPGQSENVFSRRMNTAMQDPQMGIHEGLDALQYLPTDHPLRQEYTPTLVQAQMRARQGVA